MRSRVFENLKRCFNVGLRGIFKDEEEEYGSF